MDESNSGPTTTTVIYYQYDDIAYDASSELKPDPNSNELTVTSNLNPSFSSLNDSNYETKNDQTNDESNSFRALIVCLGLFIISIGILSNLIFSLIIVCRKRKRKTTSTLIMLSMCLAYIIFFIFYCFKISIYFNVETILKFHIYDITENWIYGSFMCKFISALPILCKLLTRLSILTMIIMRVLGLFVRKNCVSNSKDQNVNHRTRNNQDNIKKLNLIKKIFEFPLIHIIISIVWILSLLLSLPIFMSFRLNDISSPPICDSAYEFPDEIKNASGLYFNYLIYALVLPSVLIFGAIVFLSILQSSKSLSNSDADLRSSNLLIWFLIILHLVTSLPQELYRYTQLTQTNFDDPTQLEIMLEKPLTYARPYYSLQLLYISEFAIIPLLFLTFLTCSSKYSKVETEHKKSKVNSLLSFCFYDHNLVGVVEQEKIVFNNTTDQSLNDALLENSQTNDSKVTFNSSPNHENDKNFYNGNNQNVLHIIQHPSWRINIKQQPNGGNKNFNKYSDNDKQNGSMHLPFNYMKSNQM